MPATGVGCRVDGRGSINCRVCLRGRFRHTPLIRQLGLTAAVAAATTPTVVYCRLSIASTAPHSLTHSSGAPCVALASARPWATRRTDTAALVRALASFRFRDSRSVAGRLSPGEKRIASFFSRHLTVAFFSPASSFALSCALIWGTILLLTRTWCSRDSHQQPQRQSGADCRLATRL